MSAGVTSTTSTFTFDDAASKSKVTLCYSLYSPPKSAGKPQLPALCMIMGLSGSKEDWGILPSHLCAKLSRQVLTFDNRGMGASTVTSDPYTMALLTSDAVALIRHVFGGQRVIVFGCSMGGMIALTLAVRYPEVLSPPLIVGCSSGGNDHFVPHVGEGPSFQELVATSASSGPQDRDAIHRKFMEFQFTPNWLRSHTAEFNELLAVSANVPRPRRGVANQFAAILKFRLKAEELKLAARKVGGVLLLTGDSDSVMDWRNTRKLKEILHTEAKVKEVVWPDVGHMFWIQVRDKVEEEIIKAVKEWQGKSNTQSKL